ncbi:MULTISPECIES: Fur family transcriptional regulator [Aerococcus]|uniref:Transcriptional repressor n=1 Tax=Aerococcus sanguinicola TaxID=119206 RepID=A0A5N1GJE9_9LACT|nr:MULTISPECIES: Fur family transcriptional regulator [Aerococcus]KAA9300912.1 transcriptional repressor [Aerococcus sanguinicola]MDK6369145.1 Fur family transcriptional regulator [Aerococcus sp. UMB9870]MDK6679795.1 Fur family transcriptional regulator [Aerococcus sp. UMB8608]MDK6686638.1 Fur family transcriptional regulator [Aerococcus sp. UMB8623]MDK6939717.1 Fur family transcriptional regulator [Aerococcus sp. UMB8487]
MATDQFQELKASVQASGFKLTPQRQSTLQVLIEQSDQLLSAEQIYMYTREKNESIGLATVYRTLEILTSIQVVSKVMGSEGLAYYSLINRQSQHAPHHLVCIHCGRIIEINEDLLDAVEKEVEKNFHFKVTNHHLVIHGLCQDCQEGDLLDDQ